MKIGQESEPSECTAKSRRTR